MARPIGYYVYVKMGPRPALMVLFATSTVGSFPVMFSEMASKTFNDIIVPGCLFVMNLGTSATFGNLYIGHLDLFPSVFSSTSMGLCNIIARVLTAAAPIVAEISEPTPEIIFTALCIIAIITSYFIRKKTNKYY